MGSGPKPRRAGVALLEDVCATGSASAHASLSVQHKRLLTAPVPFPRRTFQRF